MNDQSRAKEEQCDHLYLKKDESSCKCKSVSISISTNTDGFLHNLVTSFHRTC